MSSPPSIESVDPFHCHPGAVEKVMFSVCHSEAKPKNPLISKLGDPSPNGSG